MVLSQRKQEMVDLWRENRKKWEEYLNSLDMDKRREKVFEWELECLEGTLAEYHLDPDSKEEDLFGALELCTKALKDILYFPGFPKEVKESG